MSKRASSPTQNTVSEEELAFLKQVRTASNPISAIQYVPFAVISTIVGILLYCSVGSITFKADIVYVAIASIIGIVGLTIGYYHVAEWTKKQRNLRSKDHFNKLEPLFFSLFYNNAVYVFLLLLCSSLIFSSLNPQLSMVLSLAVASLVPAWLSSLSA